MYYILRGKLNAIKQWKCCKSHLVSRVQDGQESVEDDDIVGRSKTSITGINVKKS